MKNIKYFKTLLCASVILAAFPCFMHETTSTANVITKINTNKNSETELGVFTIYTNAKAISDSKNYLKHGDLINEHEGSKQLDHDKFERTVNYVLNSIPNLNKFKNKSALKKLVIETAIVETHLGKSSYEASAKVNNYGLVQIRWQTAKEVMDILKKRDKDSYIALMKLYNSKLSLQNNLLKNVPFSIGVCAEYYLIRNKNLQNNIANTHERARQWKKFYNTNLGVGSVSGYENRVKNFYASL